MSEPFQLTPRIARQLPWLVAVAFFMQALDGTILNTALPSMASSLNENPLRMQAVVIAYLLTVALLIPASGWIADRFGTRRVFLGAVLLFSLGSLLCALSPSLELLVGARIVQGVGGALMMPVGRLVILRVYPRQDLVRVLSFVTIPGLLGPLAGPTLGGWLVEYASWHWIFLINLPVGLLGCLVAMKLMPDLRSPVPSRFDSIGFLLFGGSMVLISIALEGLGELHLSHLRVVLLLIGGLVLLTAYWLRALRIDKPLFPPSLFKARTFAVGILGNLFARLGSGALPFLTPLLLQVGLGYPPSTAGMTMIPLALFAMVAKPMAKPLLDFFGSGRAAGSTACSPTPSPATAATCGRSCSSTPPASTTTSTTAPPGATRTTPTRRSRPPCRTCSWSPATSGRTPRSASASWSSRTPCSAIYPASARTAKACPRTPATASWSAPPSGSPPASRKSPRAWNRNARSPSTAKRRKRWPRNWSRCPRTWTTAIAWYRPNWRTSVASSPRCAPWPRTC